MLSIDGPEDAEAEPVFSAADASAENGIGLEIFRAVDRQHAGELAPRPVDSALDRPDRAAAQAGRLAIRKPGGGNQHEGFARLRVKLRQGGAKLAVFHAG